MKGPVKKSSYFLLDLVVLELTIHKKQSQTKGKKKAQDAKGEKAILSRQNPSVHLSYLMRTFAARDISQRLIPSPAVT